MPVPEQIPYVGYIANGQTTEFPITFDLHDPEFLIVTLNKEIPIVGAYTIDMNAKKVVFATAPNDNDQVELYRETELNRDIDYKSYDNSFRAEVINYDLDTVMRILQEQHMIDGEIAARIKGEIEWRRTHDANFDELSKMRDAQIFSGLKQYLDTILAMTNPNIFDGITAGIVFALDKKSVQTHLEIIYAMLKSNHNDFESAINSEKTRALAAEAILLQKIQNEVLRATTVESNLQLQISTSVNGIKYFETEAQLNAYTPGEADPKQAYVFATKKNYLWDGSTWKDEGLSTLDQAKEYSETIFKKIYDLFKTFNVNQQNLNTGERIWLSIQDKLSKAVFSIGEKNLQWNNLNIGFENSSNSIKISDKIGRTILSLSKDGITFGRSKLVASLNHTILDKIGRSAFKINKDGSIFIPNLTVQSIKKIGEFGAVSDITAQRIPKLGFHKYPKRIGIISSGQSLNMGGADTSYQVSTTQPFNNVMFEAGAYKQAQDINYVPTAFTPLIGNYLDLEFPVLNGCNALSRQIDKSIDLDPMDYSIWGQVIGEGGQTVEYLTEHYLPKLKKAVDNFKFLCDKNSETGEIWSLVWIQGESNSSVAIKDWSAKVLQYQSEAIDHILKTTGQTAIPYIYIYQFASFFHFFPEFGYQTAQQEWLMSKNVENVVCFTPMYIFDYIDNLHLNPIDYWFMGEYIGRAIHYTQFANQGKFRPVEPIDVIWTDNYIDIVFHAPKYPLRFTTDLCTQAINQGFNFYKNKEYQAGFISSVELKDYRTVRINLTTPITDPDFEICYARGFTGTDSGSGRTTGARGNLADSTRESVTSPTSVTRIISHHSVAFTYHKTNGFVV